MPQPPQRHSRQPELHRTDRVGWLRAAVLGANDGIVSVSGVVVGVAASGAAPGAILTAGIAATVAGAMSMAAGEYVSVQSQADTEQADMAIERRDGAITVILVRIISVKYNLNLPKFQKRERLK